MGDDEGDFLQLLRDYFEKVFIVVYSFDAFVGYTQVSYLFKKTHLLK
jgi:hypothetical protein